MSSNTRYSEPRSLSPNKLAQIRGMKRVEPQNTGINHPTNIYIPVGHGSETVGEKHVVPKGCILVVKSHSGDTTLNLDFNVNIKAILDVDNKETIFDPVSHKKELFSLLNADVESQLSDISASNSTAIYREGDTYNNFRYQVVSKFPNSIGISGIFSLENTAISDFKEIGKPVEINNDTKVFVKDLSGNYIYSPDLIQLDIPSFFTISNAYEYYYTPQHINDILELILLYLNTQKDKFMNLVDFEESMVLSLGDMYLNIKKGYTRGVSEFKDSPVYIIAQYGIGSACMGSVSREDINQFRALESKNIKDDPRNKWTTCLADMKLNTLFSIITFMTQTTQADLFKDIEAGLIKPGIFYNLICRATNRTFHTKNNTNRTGGILNRKYIENSDHTILVHNQIGEIKNRISEAILQRKNQARQVFNNKAKKIYSFERIKEDDSDIDKYITMMEMDNDTGLYNLESIKKDIKLQAFNHIISKIEMYTKLKDSETSQYVIEQYKKDLVELNNVLSKYYSKEALLAENKRLSLLISHLIQMQKDPKEIEFLKGKIEFNTNFIKTHIKARWFSLLNSPTQFINTKEEKKNSPKILTNYYKNYRNATPKNYKKVNGRWVENVPVTGGKRKTRKNRRRF